MIVIKMGSLNVAVKSILPGPMSLRFFLKLKCACTGLHVLFEVQIFSLKFEKVKRIEFQKRSLCKTSVLIGNWYY